MRVELAVKMVEYEMEQFPSLFDWRVETTKRAIKRRGLCVYREKRIVLSEKFIVLNTVERVRMTGLHEIAHALTPGHHHDHVWKAMAAQLGIPATTCNAPAVMPLAKYFASCPNCRKVFTKAKRPKGEHWCGKCGRIRGPLIFTLTPNHITEYISGT